MIRGGSLEIDGLTVKIVTNKYDVERTFEDAMQRDCAIDAYNHDGADLETAMQNFLDWDYYEWKEFWENQIIESENYGN